MNERTSMMKEFFLRRRMCFVHPHRTGGTSVFDALGLPNTHVPTRIWVGIFGADVFRSLFSFAFARDPWDRAASTYLWVTKHVPERPPFAEWVGRQKFASDKRLHPQCRMLDGPGGVTVSRVGRFETIDEDWRRIRERIGFGSETLKVLRPTQRRKSYRHMYDDRTRDRVAEVYAEDIERFGYEF